MSTAKGNIKISELNPLTEIGTNEGNKLKIPVSKKSGDESNPIWKSFSVDGNVLLSFIENNLSSSGSGSGSGSTDDIRSKVTELEKILGKYNVVTDKDISYTTGYYVSTSGQIKASSAYFTSSEIPLNQGNLYLYKANDVGDLPSDISLISKVDKSAGIYDQVYEPLPNHYHTADGGYGAPDSKYLVFFAPENMNVVISSSVSSLTDNNNKLREVKYGAFIEIADNLLSINGELMKVIVEAIVKNKKDIDSINANMKSLGDIHVTSIDSDEFPCVQGEPMVVVADRAPSAEAATHGDDVPNRIGQIWVDTKGKKAYIAIALGSYDSTCWKPITA